MEYCAGRPMTVQIVGFGLPHYCRYCRRKSRVCGSVSCETEAYRGNLNALNCIMGIELMPN